MLLLHKLSSKINKKDYTVKKSGVIMRKEIIKKLGVLIFMNSVAMSAFAAETTKTGQVKLTANLQSGCFIQAKDKSFGNIFASNGEVPDLNPEVQIRCSKNTTVTLSAKSNHNPSGNRGFYMGLDNTQVPQNDLDKDTTVFLPYSIWTKNIINTSDYTIIKRPQDNLLVEFTGQRYSLTLKMLTGNTVDLPLTMEMRILSTITGFNKITKKDLFLMKPGNYYDTLVYNVAF